MDLNKFLRRFNMYIHIHLKDILFPKSTQCLKHFSSESQYRIIPRK